KAHHRTPLFGDVTQPSPISAGLFQRHQPEIARNLLPTLKSLCFPNDQHKGQRGEWADTGMSHQSLRFRALFCLLLDGLTQFRDSRVQSIQQLQQIAASPAGPWSQPKRAAVRVPATASSYSAVLRSVPGLAVDS